MKVSCTCGAVLGTTKLKSHIEEQHNTSFEEYVLKNFKCINSNSTFGITVNDIKSVNIADQTFRIFDGCYDYHGKQKTVCKTPHHLSSYLKRKHNMSLIDYCISYLKLNNTDFKMKICPFCNTDYVKVVAKLDENLESYTLVNEYQCTTESCRKLLYETVFPDSEYTRSDYCKVAGSKIYMSIALGVPEEEVKEHRKNKSYNTTSPTLEGFVNKYGEEEGTRRYNKRCQLISENGNMSINYYLKKYDNYDDAVNAYNDRLDKLVSVGKNHRSKIETEVYNKLKVFVPELLRTKRITLNTGKCCYVDMLYKNNNVVIEFFGDYWHCNPAVRLYENSNFYNKNTRLTSAKTWEKDNMRVRALEELGYKVIVVWEKQYNANKELTILNLVSEIKNVKH